MKFKILLIFIILIHLSSKSQISFQENNIIDYTYTANGAISVFAADGDGDGDMDVISTSINEDKIAWYQNLGTLSISEFDLSSFSIYPNPKDNLVNIVSKTDILQIVI